MLNFINISASTNYPWYYKSHYNIVENPTLFCLLCISFYQNLDLVLHFIYWDLIKCTYFLSYLIVEDCFYNNNISLKNIYKSISIKLSSWWWLVIEIKKCFQTLKTTDLFKVVTDMIIRCTTSWTKHTWLFSDKRQFLALLIATIKVVV